MKEVSLTPKCYTGSNIYFAASAALGGPRNAQSGRGAPKSLALPVGRIRSVLAFVVLSQQGSRYRGHRRVDLPGSVRQARDVLEHHCIVRGIGGGLTPGKWGVARHQNSGGGNGVKSAKALDDHSAGIQFIRTLDLLIAERRRYRHISAG